MACDLKYSGAGVAFLLGAFAATTALVLLLPFTPFLRASLLAYVFLQSARACLTMLSWRALRIDRHRELHLLGADGRWREGSVQDGSVVLSWFVAVRWRPSGARFDRALLLLPGMADRDALRNIRVLLRCT